MVLFDEIEKAHRDVYNMLLQLLEDGTLTDAKGRSVDFTNTIIILTSNVGADEMMKESKLGFQAVSKADREALDDVHSKNASHARKALEKIMRPELINRFDAFVTFRALTKREVGKIFDNLIGELNDRLMKKGMSVIISSPVKRLLVDEGHDEKYGARPLRRTLQDRLEHVIAEGIIDGAYEKGDVLEAVLEKKKVVVHVRAEAS